MTELEFKQYIESIQDEPEFISLNKFIQFSIYSKNGELSMFEAVKEYLKLNHSRRDTDIPFDPDYDHFYNFYEKYKNKDASIVYKAEGEIDLGKTPHLVQPARVAKNKGYFTDNYLILPDGTIFISKIPLNYKSSISLEREPNCRYNTIIATKMAKKLGITTSENFLARLADGQYRTLSKFFLRPNEEFVTFFKDEGNPKISTIYKKLEETLTLRKYPAERIEEIKMEFLKQEFLAKLIGLDDQKADNTGLIAGIDANGERTIRLTPMFDYDYSFLTGEKSDIVRRQADNGKTDIVSLIEQYKDNPDFMQFVKKSLTSFDIKKVYQSLYEEDRLTCFKNYESNGYLCLIMGFVDYNLKRAREKLKELKAHERGE